MVTTHEGHTRVSLGASPLVILMQAPPVPLGSLGHPEGTPEEDARWHRCSGRGIQVEVARLPWLIVFLSGDEGVKRGIRLKFSGFL